MGAVKNNNNPFAFTIFPNIIKYLTQNRLIIKSSVVYGDTTTMGSRLEWEPIKDAPYKKYSGHMKRSFPYSCSYSRCVGMDAPEESYFPSMVMSDCANLRRLSSTHAMVKHSYCLLHNIIWSSQSHFTARIQIYHKPNIFPALCIIICRSLKSGQYFFINSIWTPIKYAL